MIVTSPHGGQLKNITGLVNISGPELPYSAASSESYEVDHGNSQGGGDFPRKVTISTSSWDLNSSMVVDPLRLGGLVGVAKST